jgi:hypothetical protein
MKKRFIHRVLLLLILCLFALEKEGFSQLLINAQLRTRTEFRDGQGTLPLPHQTPSVFTSQRTRLNIGYGMDKLRVFTSIQDIRVWGQDASTISNMDGNKLFLHEAWGEIIFNDTTLFKTFKNVSFKLGRQELVYDDERLLGALAWLQQGRRHDAAVLKFAKGTWTADIGGAFNQQRELKNTGNIYYGVPGGQIATDSANVAAPAGSNFIGTMYKSMQFIHVSKEIGFSKATFLLFKDDFQKPAAGGKFTKGTNSRVTVGGNIFGTLMRKHKIDGSFFYQGNKDKLGNKMDAYMASLSTLFAIDRKLSLGLGGDFLSGNNTTKSGEVNRRFDPLYGTPHKFWGYMDYFYVADVYGVQGNVTRNPGLIDLYIRSKYKLKDNLLLSLDIHEFYAGNKVADETAPGKTLDGRLGTEFDFILNYNFTKQIGIEAGYSLMLGTNTLDRLKRGGNQGAIGATANAPYINKRNNGNWAYLMITIRPDLLGQINDKLASLVKSVDGLKKDVDTLNQPK